MMKKLGRAIKNKNYIVFDFDLTIAKMEIDWTNWHKGIVVVFSKFDLNHGYTKGTNPHNFYNNMVNKYGYELTKAVRLFNEEYERQNIRGFTPSILLVKFIKEVKDKKLYIFSSNSKKTIEIGLKKLGILSCFEQIISRDDTKYLKPNQEGFSLIPDFEKNKSSFIMIGDSSSDKEAAQKAGIDFFKYDEFVTYKF